MNKIEFLEMMKKDIATSDSEEFKAIVELMDKVLASVPNDTEIDKAEKKDAKGCLEFLRAEAKKKAKENCYYMGEKESLTLIAKYLNIDNPEIDNLTVEKTKAEVVEKKVCAVLDKEFDELFDF